MYRSQWHSLFVLGLLGGVAGCVTGPAAVDNGDDGVRQVPKRYVCRYAVGPLDIDGRLDDAAWADAAWTDAFVDIEGDRKPAPRFETRVKMLWDDEYLYIAYWIEEPDLQATLTERDAPIYQNNDVELFIAGKDGYYEFEINSFGTIYEVLFIWNEAYKAGGYDKIEGLGEGEPGSQPFNGVAYKNHPRGLRTGFFKWDFPGLKSAVYMDGTINEPGDRDRGWTVELALPWAGMEVLARGDDRSLPPLDEDVWRMDFSRFNQYKEAPPAEDNGGWAWSPHGVWDSHVPECFTYIHFSTEAVSSR